MPEYPDDRPDASAGALLAATDVSVRYGKGAPVVHGAGLTVFAGDAIGIVGESGSGKSTFAKALAGDLAPSSGQVRVLGRSWSEVRRGDRERRMVQMVFQDPYSALNPLMSPRATVEEALHVVAGVGRKLRPGRAKELLASVGLHGAAIDQRPKRLSGGQRQRVVIARALACEPDVLVADEPTSALDLSVQAQILNLLLDLRAERNLALVLVSHDLAVMKHMTDTCAVMQAGRIVEFGMTEDVLERPQHPYTQSLLAARSVADGAIRGTR